jgi:hypothetical protein
VGCESVMELVGWHWRMHDNGLYAVVTGGEWRPAVDVSGGCNPGM